jgi:LSD1 subclass zinc finger protein
MMLTKLNCSACGAPISVPDGLDYINCSSCGTFLVIERGEGYMALKVAEKIVQAIEDSGRGTQDVIRENTKVTQAELKRLQETQEISNAEMQLSTIQTEIRGILRAEQNKRTEEQLNTLRLSEYEAMEKVWSLYDKYTAPDPKNLLACAKFAEREIEWVETEIQVLLRTNSQKSNENVQFLRGRKQRLMNKAKDLRLQGIRDSLPSFQVIELPLNNQAEAAALLPLLAEDVKNMRNKSGSQESYAVYNELIARQRTLQEAWNRMENERLIGILSSPNFSVDRDDPLSLSEYLSHINQDLTVLGNITDNPIAQEIQRKLLSEQEKTQKKINLLARKAKKATQNADQARDSSSDGFLTVMLAGFSTLFAGIAALFTSLSKSKPADSASKPTAGLVSETSSDENEPANPASAAKKSNFINVGIAFLLSLLILIAVSSVCFIPLIIAFPDSAKTGGPLVGGLFLSLTVGLIVSMGFFLRRAAPNTCIRGVGGLPTINIARSKLSNGLKNPLAVKGLVGISSCLITWSLFLAIAGYCTAPSSSLSTIFILIGTVFGPVMAVITAAHTDIQKVPAE